MDRNAYGSVAAAASNEKWYYISGGKKQGPVDADRLTSMLTSGSLPADTRVWTNGMDNWSPASGTSLMNGTGNAMHTAGAGSQDAADNTPAKRKSRWWIWLVAVLLVGGIAAGCYFLFFANAGGGDQAEELVYKLEDPVIYKDDFCEFIIDAVGEKGDYLELDVRCVNKTNDTLSFIWDSTCINGSMFDPLWQVVVMGQSTMRSSITFPRSTLEEYNLLPANQIKFVLRVHNEDQFSQLQAESAGYIMAVQDIPEGESFGDYRYIEGYEGYLFAPNVLVDDSGRPYYMRADEKAVYFDELYDRYGQHLYPVYSEVTGYESFYNDPFGRPYYFSEYGDTVYYDGYGYAFYDDEAGKHYFFDESGKAAYYGNGGVPEYYEGKITEELLDEQKPEALVKASGSYLVHKEFSIYPTGKKAEEVTRPERVSASSEQVYWDGDKGKFIVLGGELDEFKGYIVHAYVENDSDSYIYLGWSNCVVNGVAVEPDTITVLRPHSSAYRDIIIPASVLKENKIKTVERIDFNVYAVGENLSIPLYPIEWTAVAITELSKEK